MTTLTAIAICYGVFMLVVWAICSDSKRRDIDAARRIHPSTLPPGVQWAPTFDDATEAAIVEAAGIVDDGKRLVAEVEDHLRRRSR